MAILTHLCFGKVHVNQVSDIQLEMFLRILSERKIKIFTRSQRSLKTLKILSFKLPWTESFDVMQDFRIAMKT